MEYKEYIGIVKDKLGSYCAKEEFVDVTWCIGGLTGGSCWGGNADTPVSAEVEPEFEDLDLLLEAVCPNITFLQYKNLCRKVIETDSYRNNDYYGNYYEYARKRVNLTTLYHYLAENNLI